MDFRGNVNDDPTNYHDRNNEDNDRTSLINDSVNNGQYQTISNSTQSRITTNNGVSSYFAVFLIVNSALGAGVLNFGKAFDEAGGITISVSIQLVLAILNLGSLIILAYCTDKKNASNFQDVVYSMCGKGWQTLNSVFIIMYMFGCCVTFFILIGDQFEQTFVIADGPATSWFLSRKFLTTVSSIIFILPLCYPKRIDFLTYPSMFAVIAVIYIVFLVPAKYFNMDTSDVIVKTGPDQWTDVFSVLPVICFSYQCHVNVVPIYACLKNKNLNKFIGSLTLSIVIVFIVYTVCAVFGYLTFGVAIDDDLLKSYDSREPSVLIGLIMYLIKTFTGYPLNLFCARTAIEGLWIEIFRLNSNSIVQNERKRRIAIVTVWFFLSLIIALYLPNISVVIHYLGALAATFVFVFPGLCLLFLTLNNNETDDDSQASQKYFSPNALILISCMYIVIGVFVMGLVITQSLLNDFV